MKNEHINEDWTECWNCFGYIFTHHDCGEDTCCCLEPEDNVLCDVCHGHGGWGISESEQENSNEPN